MTYDGSIKIDTKIDTSGAEDDLDKLKNSAKKGAAVVGTAIAAGIGAATKVGMDFESSMSQVAATMGMTSEEIQNGSKEYTLLADTAKKCGAETKFTASESAEALNYLALAGYDAEKAASTLPKVLDLAAAGGIGLADASSLVTDSMCALGIETNDLDTFIDQMTKTSQKSNTNIAQLGEAILTVGGTAKSLSGGTVELNTQLGILADNGIKGAEGGMALRNIILAFSAPTKKAADTMKKLGVDAFDADGNLRPLKEVFFDLNQGLSGLTEKEKNEVLYSIFHRVDLKSANALLGTSTVRFSELENEIKNSSGAAATMASVMNDNLKGKITILESALEGLGIKVYSKFEEPFKNAVDNTTGAVDKLAKSIESGGLSKAIDCLGFLVQTVGPGVVVFTATVKGYEVATKAAAAAQALLNGAMALNPVAAAAGAIAGISLATFNLIMANDTLTEDIYVQSEAYGKLCDKVNTQKTAYDELKEASDEQMNSDLAQIDHVENLYNELENLTDATGKVEEADRSRADFIIKEINEIIPDALEMVDGEIRKNKDLEQSIQDVINMERAKIILASEEAKYSEAVKNVADAQSAQAQTASQLALKQTRLNELLKEQEERLKSGLSADITLTEQIAPLQRSVEELSGTLAEQTRTLDGYYSDIKRYEDDYAAIQSGNAEQIQAVIDKTSDAYKSETEALAQSVDEKKDILARSVIDAETQYGLLLEKFKAGEGKITQEQVNAARERADSATEEFKAVGGNIVDGIIVGVNGKSEYLNVSIANVVKAAVEAAKKAGDIHSPSRVMRDEIGAMLAEGIAVGIEENGEKATEQFDNLLGILDKKKDFGIISDEKYYDELKQLRDKYLSVGTKEWFNYTKKLLDYQDDYEKDMLKSCEEARDEEFDILKKKLSYGTITEGEYYNRLGQLRDKYFDEDSEQWQEHSHEIARYSEKVIENYINLIKEYASGADQIINSTKSKLSDTDELFTTITSTYKGVGEHGEDFVITRAKLNDLDEQTEKLREYADTILAVKQRGELPDGFFDELKELSVDEGLNFAKALLDANDEEFAKYLQSYKDKEAEISRIANELNADEIGRQKDELMKKLEEMYGEVPEDFFSCGTDSANSFKDGFLDSLPEMFEEIRQAFSEGFTAMMPSISFVGADGSGGNTYTSSYNFYSSGQTVSEQLSQARANSVVERMRGNA